MSNARSIYRFEPEPILRKLRTGVLFHPYRDETNAFDLVVVGIDSSLLTLRQNVEVSHA